MGNANKVFRNVITIPLPGNDSKAIVNPAGTPIIPAISVDARLTFKDTPTMKIISASKEKIRKNERKQLRRVKERRKETERRHNRKMRDEKKKEE